MAMQTGAERLVAIAILAAASCTAHAQSVLGADVLKQSFPGNTAEFVEQSNAVAVFWDQDGTQRMQNQRLGPDRGEWRITPEGEFCGNWTKLRKGAETCAPVIDLGGGLFQWGNSKFRVLLGNPKGL
jgi:hypothetical protein